MDRFQDDSFLAARRLALIAMTKRPMEIEITEQTSVFNGRAPTTVSAGNRDSMRICERERAREGEGGDGHGKYRKARIDSCGSIDRSRTCVSRRGRPGGDHGGARVT